MQGMQNTGGLPAGDQLERRAMVDAVHGEKSINSFGHMGGETVASLTLRRCSLESPAYIQDISGDTFLRKLLAMPPEDATLNTGQDAVYGNNSPTITVDPRSIAQRILDVSGAFRSEINSQHELAPIILQQPA